jgi:hypothetical protein
MFGAHRFRGINMPTLTVANLLFSPTAMILGAASAALVISVGVLLTWPPAKRNRR